MAYKVYDIEYDIIPADIQASKTQSEYEIVKKINTIKERLPKVLMIRVLSDDTDTDTLQEILAEEVSDETGYCVNNFKYILFGY